MSRNLLIVRVDKKIKIAQYCQENGIPMGQGQVIQDFMNNEMDLRVLKAKVKRLTWASDEEIASCWKDVGATGDLVTVGQSMEFKRIHPEFHRATGAEILYMAQAGEMDKVASSLDFRKDELFCEYVYDLNLDTKKIRIYFFGKRYQTMTFDQFKQENLAKLESKLESKMESKILRERENEDNTENGEKDNKENEEELVVDSNQDSPDLAFSGKRAKSVPNAVGFPIRIPVKRKLML